MLNQVETKHATADHDGSPDTDKRIPQQDGDESKHPFLTGRTLAMGALAGMGGLCWGYDTGEISGFQEMER